jgi:CspA family cold shock protein
MAEILKGQVKWFNDAKGFGFIEHSNGEDVFVHYSVIEWDGFKTLKDGEEVEYELKAGQKGLHAARVSRPQALKKRLDKKALEAITGQVAPNLQSGQVSSIYKPAASMVEVEELQANSAELENSALAQNVANAEMSREKGE